MSTIRKVADRAGVSPTTVSHVLNHADRVSEHLRVKVMAAINELCYSPNVQAKSLRTGRTNIVAMLIPDICNSFYTEMAKTVQIELGKTGRDVLVFNADVPGGNPQAHSREYLSQIRSKGVDGLIVGDFALHGMYEAIEDVTIPSVFVGYLPTGAVDNVRVADYDGAFEMGNYMARRGYKRILHLTGPNDYPAAVNRRDGFTAGVLAGGLDCDALVVVEGTYLSRSAEETIHAVFGKGWPEASNARPTAVFFSNFLMCRAGLAALHDLGLRVPEDVAVGVFGDQSPMQYVRPTLTHVGVDPRRLGGEAVRLLVDRMEGRLAADPVVVTHSCRFQAGQSA